MSERQGHSSAGRRPAAGDEWYAEGLRFACTQCGNCCTGPPGAVWCTDAEIRRLAEHIGVPVETFHRTHAHRLDERWSLQERLTDHGYDCIFLDRDTIPGKAVCSVYEARPAQCRTWPFWPENLRSRRAWLTVKRRTPCPGMDEGPLVPIERIRIQRDATPEG
ncbi:MAG: YkgJ family cysteine cluster protein [Planctomycetota bacterium]|jgi:Fe-S-cluster containining protein